VNEGRWVGNFRKGTKERGANSIYTLYNYVFIKKKLEVEIFKKTCYLSWIFVCSVFMLVKRSKRAN